MKVLHFDIRLNGNDSAYDSSGHELVELNLHVPDDFPLEAALAASRFAVYAITKEVDRQTRLTTKRAETDVALQALQSIADAARAQAERPDDDDDDDVAQAPDDAVPPEDRPLEALTTSEVDGVLGASGSR